VATNDKGEVYLTQIFLNANTTKRN
jgi:hypothetical protein